MLFATGLAAVTGNLLGGRAADRALAPTLLATPPPGARDGHDTARPLPGRGLPARRPRRPSARLGYGAMRLTGQPGNVGSYADPAGGIALLRRAYDPGVRFVDTARAYGPGHDEELLARAFDPWPDDLLVATKVGIDKDAPTSIVSDGRPEALAAHVRESLERLRRDSLDLVYLHRPDPSVPLEESVGALHAMREQGLVPHVGLSNVNAAHVTALLPLGPVAAVQNRYSVVDRDDDALVDALAAAGVAYVPYGPLGANPLVQGAPLAADRTLRRAAARLDATASQPGRDRLAAAQRAERHARPRHHQRRPPRGERRRRRARGRPHRRCRARRPAVTADPAPPVVLAVDSWRRSGR